MIASAAGPPIQIQIAATDAQWDFLNSTARYTLFSGGYGAGKSHILAARSLIEAIENPGLTGMIIADTYTRLERDFIPKLRQIARASGIRLAKIYVDEDPEEDEAEDEVGLVVRRPRRRASKTPGILVGPGWPHHTLLLGSMQRPASVKGPTLSHIEVEEATLIPRKVPKLEETTFGIMLGRLRQPGGTLRISASGTPEGLANWTNDRGMFWRAPSDPERKAAWANNFRVIRGSSWDNTHNAAGYVQAMMDVLTPSQVAEKIEGYPAAGLSGQAYSEWDAARNEAPVEYDPYRGPVLIGMDFNVNPMTAVLCQFAGDRLTVFDEVVLKNSHTRLMAVELRRRLKVLGLEPRQARVYPDATGRRRQTAGTTDFAILKDEGFIRLVYPPEGNPHVSDRLNCMNSALYRRKLIVHPRCREVIADLENVVVNDDGELVKTDPMRTHTTDGLGYVVVRVLPIRPMQAGAGRAA